MWSSIWKWAKGNKLLAIIIVGVLLVAIASVADGVSARNAASRYFDLARGWAAAYQRDTAASKKEYEERIRILTADLHADETVWEDAKEQMARPWTPPKGAKALQERFKKLGYRGTLK